MRAVSGSISTPVMVEWRCIASGIRPMKTFTSLKTKDKAEANRLLMAMNEAGKQPAMNLSLARVYLRHSDPMVSTRTWQNVLEEIIALKTGPTQARWKSAAKDKAF